MYKGEFLNTKNELISVCIGLSGADTRNIRLADNPVIITSVSDGIFAPIKANSCTVKIITETVYSDIYSNTAQGTPVIVKNETTGTVLFYGYVTPNIYNQEYVGVDLLEIEAISAISSLDYFKYAKINNVTSWYDIIKGCLQKAGYYTQFYFPDNFSYNEIIEMEEPFLKGLW
jgi:hypothetical protein